MTVKKFDNFINDNVNNTINIFKLRNIKGKYDPRGEYCSE